MSAFSNMAAYCRFDSAQASDGGLQRPRALLLRACSASWMRQRLKHLIERNARRLRLQRQHDFAGASGPEEDEVGAELAAVDCGALLA
jgi:hypothetical protein